MKKEVLDLFSAKKSGDFRLDETELERLTDIEREFHINIMRVGGTEFECSDPEYFKVILESERVTLTRALCNQKGNVLSLSGKMRDETIHINAF